MKLDGRNLYTLDRQTPFTSVSITGSTAIVRPRATGKDRPFPRAGIEGAYRHLVATGRLTVAEIEKEFAPFNGVRYPLVGWTRQRHFDGASFEPRKLPENAQTPTCRLHAVLARFG